MRAEAPLRTPRPRNAPNTRQMELHEPESLLMLLNLVGRVRSPDFLADVDVGRAHVRVGPARALSRGARPHPPAGPQAECTRARDAQEYIQYRDRSLLRLVRAGPGRTAIQYVVSLTQLRNKSSPTLAACIFCSRHRHATAVRKRAHRCPVHTANCARSRRKWGALCRSCRACA